MRILHTIPVCSRSSTLSGRRSKVFQCPLLGGAAGPRSATGASVRVLHGRSVSVSRLVKKLLSADRGLAIHRGVLDPFVRCFGRTRVRGLSGQRRNTKTLPGRKSDVQESQWLLKLHTYGLLNNSFQPTSEIRVLRTYWRQRAQHVSAAATCVQRMQKALTQMKCAVVNNVKLAHQSPAKHGLFDSQLHIFCSVGTAAKTRWLPSLITWPFLIFDSLQGSSIRTLRSPHERDPPLSLLREWTWR
jgi:hypothetical protein